jgi:hypothetical protein
MIRFLVCLMALRGMFDAAGQPAPANLVRNPGFEQTDAQGQPADWGGWNDVWQADDSVARSGSRSARFRNADPNRYLLLTQAVPARPGHRYRLACRIKTDNIQGDDSGATACLEWSDGAGKWLGGFYPAGFKGTNDWKRLEDISPRIPQEAARGSTWSLQQVGDWQGDEAIVRGVVSTFRSHPAVLAWYLNDELPLSWHDKLARNYRWLRALDPDHPGYVVLYQVGELEGYGDTTDVFGVDPYPIPAHPVTMVSEWTDAAVRMGRPAWIVPQIFDWSVYNKDNKPSPPTLEEMRCMICLALLHGANGLIAYSYFDLKRAPEFERRWGDVKRIAAEVKRLTPWLLEGRHGPLQKVGGLEMRTWRKGQETVLVVANPTRQAAEARIPVPQGARRLVPLFEGETLTAQDGRFAVACPPLGVSVWRTVR